MFDAPYLLVRRRDRGLPAQTKRTRRLTAIDAQNTAGRRAETYPPRVAGGKARMLRDEASDAPLPRLHRLHAVRARHRGSSTSVELADQRGIVAREQDIDPVACPGMNDDLEPIEREHVIAFE